MSTLYKLGIGIFAVFALVSCAYATVVAPSIVPVAVQGNVALGSSLTANASVAPLPAGQSQGLFNDIGFAVTGLFQFDTSDPSNLSPSVNYNISEPIYLTPGGYEASSYLSAGISDTQVGVPSGLNYLQDFQVTTNVFSDSLLTDLVASSGAGQLGFPSIGYGAGGAFPFCQLPSCAGLGSGNPAGEGSFLVATGATYYLQQSFIATVSGVGLNDVIQIDLPNTSGVGSTAPEPGTWGLLAGGMVALLFARRYAIKVTQA